jgi:predicted nucleic acid-binding protein
VIVLSDSGPIIALCKINHLDILREFFRKIIIPQAVWTEVVERGGGRPGSKEVQEANWIEVKKVKNIIGIEALKHEIGMGESETIVLSKELNADIVLIDDKIAREIARSMDMNVAGTLSIIHEAINNKIIDENFKEIIKLMRKNNIWISDELLNSFEK